MSNNWEQNLREEEERYLTRSKPVYDRIYKTHNIVTNKELQTKLHIDVIATTLDDKKILIEEKHVAKDYERIFLETYSCTNTKLTDGWIKFIYPSSIKEQILLNFTMPSYIYSFDMRRLQEWYREANLTSYLVHTEKTSNKSQGILVPISDIYTCLIARYRVA
jgi:hypothetical protein